MYIHIYEKVEGMNYGRMTCEKFTGHYLFALN